MSSCKREMLNTFQIAKVNFGRRLNINSLFCDSISQCTCCGRKHAELVYLGGLKIRI